MKPGGDAPESSSGGKIDTVAMIAAWDINVEVQRRIIQQLERNEDANERTLLSNRRTRQVMYGVAFVLVVSLGWIHHLAIELSDGNTEIVRLAAAGGDRLTSVESTLKLVAGAVVATNEAAATQAEAEDAAAPSTVRLRRRSAAQVAADDATDAKRAQKRRQAREMNIVAKARAVKAQVRLADGAVQRARAETKLRRIEAEARTANLDPTAF